MDKKAVFLLRGGKMDTRKRKKAREIKGIEADGVYDRNGKGVCVEISGWLDGPSNTYLWFGLNGRCIGTLEGASLKRLVRNLMKEYVLSPTQTRDVTRVSR